MLYLTCIMISSVDLAHYGASCAKHGVSVGCGTIINAASGQNSKSSEILWIGCVFANLMKIG